MWQWPTTRCACFRHDMGGFSRAQSRRQRPRPRDLFPQRRAISDAVAPVLIQGRSRLESLAVRHARGVGRCASHQRPLGSAIGALGGGVSPRSTWPVLEERCDISWQLWPRPSTHARFQARTVSGGSRGRFQQPRRDRQPPSEGDRPYLSATWHLRIRQLVGGSLLWSRRSLNHAHDSSIFVLHWTGSLTRGCTRRPREL